MDIDTDTIRNLPVADRLVLIEQIWRDLVAGTNEIPISDDVLNEAARRRDEMIANPALGSSHETTWDRIKKLPQG